MEEQQVYSVIGDEGFHRLVASFYRQVPSDPVLGPMYPAQDLAGAEERLRNFLIFRFGGPVTYLDTRGHPRLRMRHAPFVVNEQARQHWMLLMDRALEETQLPSEARSILREFFASTAEFLKNAGD